MKKTLDTAASVILMLGIIGIGACDKGGGGAITTSPSPSPSVSADPYLYVASGTAYVGNGITAASPINTVVRYRLNGGFESVVMDYTAFPGDSPVGLADYDANHLLVLVENASGRRIDKVAKDGSGAITFIANSTALSAQLRSIFPTADGGWVISKGTAVEKFGSSKSRVMMGPNPFVSAPAAPCATSTTLISKVIEGPGQNLFYTHAAASPNNKIGIISKNGYSVAGDCLAATAGPSANHWPTAALVHSSGKLLVSYSNNTGPVNEIYSYPITATTIGAGVSALNSPSLVQGMSAMVELPDATVLVAAMTSTFNTIEQFSFDSTANTLSRVGMIALIGPSVYTRSVSAMLVAP